MFKGLPPRQIELLSSAIAEQTVRGEVVKWWGMVGVGFRALDEV